VPGKRERDQRTGWGVPIKPSLSMVVSLAMHPLWLLGLLRKGPISVPNVAAMMGSENLVAQTRFFHDQLDASVVWKDVREMIEWWGGPFAIKGVMSVDDARRAVDVGATAVIVSNHGGRQLDGAAASVEVLPEIARAIGSSVDVILDGGVRRGVHILKALALGADACSMGRPYLFGLGAGGEAGVAKAFEILTSELVRAMQLAGIKDLGDVDPGIVRGRDARRPTF
jgi:L-lactate dehydrogenase (cytochrome)